METPRFTYAERAELARQLHRRLERMETIQGTIAQALQAVPSQARQLELEARARRVRNLHRQTRQMHALLYSAEFKPFLVPRQNSRARI